MSALQYVTCRRTLLTHVRSSKLSDLTHLAYPGNSQNTSGDVISAVTLMEAAGSKLISCQTDVGSEIWF